MNRDPIRLLSFYEVMKEIHMTSMGYLRFGQMILNFFDWLGKKDIDPFFLEEPEMLRWFKEYSIEISCLKGED